VPSPAPPKPGYRTCHTLARRVSPGVYLAFMYTSYTPIASKIHG
jgi:hypothetical protein